MSIKLTDPLLAFAKAGVWFLTILFGFVGSVLLLVAPVVIAMQDEVLAELAKEGAAQDPSIVGAIALLLIAGAVMMGLLVWFLVNLRRIIESVGEGDPFVPVNAVRLARMAWISIGAQIAALPVGAMVLYIDSAIGDGPKGDVDVDFTLDFGGIALAVILFILARVFRQGAAMREDLEGTV